MTSQNAMTYFNSDQKVIINIIWPIVRVANASISTIALMQGVKTQLRSPLVSKTKQVQVDATENLNVCSSCIMVVSVLVYIIFTIFSFVFRTKWHMQM